MKNHLIKRLGPGTRLKYVQLGSASARLAKPKMNPSRCQPPVSPAVKWGHNLQGHLVKRLTVHEGVPGRPSDSLPPPGSDCAGSGAVEHLLDTARDAHH